MTIHRVLSFLLVTLLFAPSILHAQPRRGTDYYRQLVQMPTAVHKLSQLEIRRAEIRAYSEILNRGRLDPRSFNLHLHHVPQLYSQLGSLNSLRQYVDNMVMSGMSGRTLHRAMNRRFSTLGVTVENRRASFPEPMGDEFIPPELRRQLTPQQAQQSENEGPQDRIPNRRRRNPGLGGMPGGGYGGF